MIRDFLLHTAIATLVVAAPAVAQDGERIRSSGYEGKAGGSDCKDWSVDFEFNRCERMPLPNDPETFGQVYTLPDGGMRTLTVDPGAAPATADADGVDPREGLSLVESVTEAVTGSEGQDDREATGAAIAGATANRSGEPPAAADGSGSAVRAKEGANATAGEETSEIVEENFILPPVVASIPGRAEIMPMAMGHLNRIETPFNDPMVRSAAAADAMTIEFDQNFVYVAVTQPVTLFIHEKGYPDPAIVVSLVPQRIAPRQVRVTLPSTAMREVQQHAATVKANNAPRKPAAESGPKANSAGVRREPEPRAATNTVAHMVQDFSQGKLPAGFVNISLEGFEAAAFCSHAGVRFSFRQGAGIASNEYIIVRGMAEASKTTELNEQWCARHPQTLAAAFAPRTQIGPNHPADFYVMIRRPNAAIQAARKGGN